MMQKFVSAHRGTGHRRTTAAWRSEVASQIE
jgi:hypothetical protein